MFAMDYAGTKELKDVVIRDNIFIKSGAGKVNTTGSEIFHIQDNVMYGGIDIPSTATGTVNKDPTVMAPGLLDPYAYLLRAGSSALDSAPAVPGNAASTDFFGNPAGSHSNYGFYSGASIVKPPAWVSDFDTASELSKWTPKGYVSTVPDPDGNLGRSARIAKDGAITRKFDADITSFRFGARLRFTAITGSKGPVVSLGLVSISFDPLTTYDVGYWRDLQVVVDGTSVKAMLDGVEVQTGAGEQAAGSVAFEAIEQMLFVDDVYVFPA